MKVMIQRKLISGLFTAVSSSYIFMFIDGRSSYIIYFSIFAIGCLIIGVPCSVIAELIASKVKTKIPSLLVSGAIHFIFAGIIIILLIFDEQGGLAFFINYSNGVAIAVVMAAIGMWVIDAIFMSLLSK